ncbi:MAG TPA: HAMP domain-containing sensor histidine kinase [Gemmataceae bacterium]|jgi:signal transduction histidine kinase
MSLTTRLSAYFLTALALVLLGFSTVLYLLVRRHLVDHTNQRLETAMQTLIAAVEVHADDVEWEPLQRHITLGEDPGEDQVRWMVHDASGRLVDCSRNLEPGPEQQPAMATPPVAHAPGSSEGWRVLGRRLQAGRFDPQLVDGLDDAANGDLGEGIAAGQLPGEVTLRSDRTYRGPAVTLRAGLSRHPVASSLRQLGWTLFGVSAGLWGIGALLSRCVCRRAIRPVVHMASCAKTLHGDQPDQLLPVAPTGDELEDLGHSFNDLLMRLREVLERQRQFTGDASHQLRTPLTAVLGQVEVALRQERSPAEYQRVLQIVQRRGGEMRQTVELLLFLARMPARTEPPDTRILSLASWLEEYARRWTDHPRGQDIHWPDPSADAAGDIRTQPALLGQLLDNLLDNACKYTAPGTPIRVRVERAQRGVMLTVSDEGPGIHAEDLPHLCDPFYRSVEARRLGRPGVGLGLTVVQRIVKVLGGELHIDSKLDEGSCFRVYLPAVGEGSPSAAGGPSRDKDTRFTQTGAN